MKNYEKYAEEIKKLDDNPSFCEQKILKPLGKSCESTDCCYCNLLKILWMLEDYEEPEVDWSKVEVDTPILVRRGDNEEWNKRYFAGYGNDGYIYAWSNGCTSWTAYDNSDVTEWEYAKLAETEGAE